MKTLKRDYAKLAERPDSQTVMAQLPKWFDDYNSYHPHSALGYVPPTRVRQLIPDFATFAPSPYI